MGINMLRKGHVPVRPLYHPPKPRRTLCVQHQYLIRFPHSITNCGPTIAARKRQAGGGGPNPATDPVYDGDKTTLKPRFTLNDSQETVNLQW